MQGSRLVTNLLGPSARLVASVLVAGIVIVGCKSGTVLQGATSAAPSGCRAPFAIGYQVMTFATNRPMAVWYPSSDPQTVYDYSSDVRTTLAYRGRPTTSCGRFPLVVFSHGLAGCGLQSIFFTETLARQGYVVVAPDHADAALCHVGSAVNSGGVTSEPSIFDPAAWTSSTYVDRRDDIETVLGAMLSGNLKAIINPQEIGLAGHSLGGYTVLGVAGGWQSWFDPRVRAVLAFSPYSLPFSIQQTLGNVHVPVMYQGAVGDIGITPFVEGAHGAYQQSNAPKYFVRLKGGNHFTWTNAVCAGHPQVADCLATQTSAQLINAYAFAFLNRYLKQVNSSLLTGPGTGLSTYQHEP